ncbi:AraC family transcriptional regulator [Gordonia neofelifaecis]|uniref:Transcriptional regulatory protein n=1 Tax=Gordonia neofelifaecis NRRL B-59395 TaxID=644548 RepID=F1YED0_9ACTN|nr:AraC family transcriptional regulator [Gordonia neofelifaecis]EGD56763.1 transcriptional regulatory protein [Gordonia neofelifaecis NRRL B-59395]
MVGPARIATRRTRVPVYAFRAEPGVPQVWVMRFDEAALTEVGAHAHEFPGIAYFEAGGGALRLGDRRERIGAGCGYLIRPGEVIAAEDAAALAGAGGWGLYFTPEVLGATDLADGGPADRRLRWRIHPLLRAFADDGPSGFVVPREDRRLWAGYLGTIEREMHERPAGYQYSVPAVLVLLLVAVSRLRAAAATPGRSDSLVDAVLDVIEQRYRGPYSLVDVAGELSFSPGHLTTEMRERTGRTVQEWITERRLIDARRLLAETDLPVAEIGRRCGYEDPGYFARVFRKVHGVPPRDWRADAG